MEPYERTELSWWMVPALIAWTAALVALMMSGLFGIVMAFLLATAGILAIYSYRLVPRRGSDEVERSKSAEPPPEDDTIEWIDE